MDAGAVYASAKAGDARIAMEIRDEEYAGRGLSCYDPWRHGANAQRLAEPRNETSSVSRFFFARVRHFVGALGSTMVAFVRPQWAGVFRLDRYTLFVKAGQIGQPV